MAAGPARTGSVGYRAQLWGTFHLITMNVRIVKYVGLACTASILNWYVDLICWGTAQKMDNIKFV